MKHLVCILLICNVALSSTAKTYYITGSNVADLSRDGAVLVIKDDLRLNGNVKLGYKSAVIFDGGSFTGSATVNFNHAHIQAAPYPIFDENLTFTGAIDNAVVEARWFGTYGQDASPVINRALAAAPASVVNIGGAEYRISTPIVMDRAGQHIRCTGTLNTTAPVAIEMHGNDLGIDAHNIEGNGKGKALSVTNLGESKIKIDRICGFDTGIDLTATGYIQYSKFDVARIEADTAVSMSAVGTNTIVGNQFRIGSTAGSAGIFMHSRADGLKPFNGNIYSGTYFEATPSPLTITGSQSERFENIIFDESVRYTLAISDTEGTEFTVRGPYSLARVDHGKNIKHVIINGFPNETSSTDRLVDMAFIDSDGVSNTSNVYLTSSAVASNVLTPIEINRNETLTPIDLMNLRTISRDAAVQLYYSYAQRIISNICTVKVAAGTFTLDLTGKADGLNDPIMIVVDTAGGQFEVRETVGKKKNTRRLSPGTYIISADNARMTLLSL